MRDWARLILDVGAEHGYWDDDRELVVDDSRRRPGSSDVQALKVGYAKLHAETGWKPLVSWPEGIARTIAWYARHPECWQ